MKSVMACCSAWTWGRRKIVETAGAVWRLATCWDAVCVVRESLRLRMSRNIHGVTRLTKHDPAWDYLEVTPDNTPAERIAVAVLLQGVKDCCSSKSVQVQSRGHDGALLFRDDGTPSTRRLMVYRDTGRRGRDAEEARQFLSTPNEMLSFWCSILSLDPDSISSAYRRRLKYVQHD